MPILEENIEKALYEVDIKRYDDILSVPLGILRYVGIFFNGPPRRWWQYYFWFEFANVFLAYCLENMKIAQTAQGGSFEDAIEIFRMMPCVGYVAMGLTKSYKMVYYRPVFMNLITELRTMWPQRMLTDEEHRIIKTAMFQLNIVVKGYYWCNSALLLVYMMAPFLELMKQHLGYEAALLLPFVYWFPFDPFSKSVYGFVLIIQTWHGVITVFFVLCGDLLFCIFLGQITMQFDLLSSRISKLLKVKSDQQMPKDFPLAVISSSMNMENNPNQLTDSEMYKELTQIIIRHRDLIRLSMDVESMYGFALLVNFLNSSVIICFCGFCCVMVERWNEMAYKFFLATALSQTWLLCWYGQRLLESGRGITGSLYSCGWYQTSQKVKTTILIMMQSYGFFGKVVQFHGLYHLTQKDVRVTTYGFSVISLVSYTAIIKTAWSYFMLLINVSNK